MAYVNLRFGGQDFEVDKNGVVFAKNGDFTGWIISTRKLRDLGDYYETPIYGPKGEKGVLRANKRTGEVVITGVTPEPIKGSWYTPQSQEKQQALQTHQNLATANKPATERPEPTSPQVTNVSQPVASQPATTTVQPQPYQPPQPPQPPLITRTSVNAPARTTAAQPNSVVDNAAKAGPTPTTVPTNLNLVEQIATSNSPYYGYVNTLLQKYSEPEPKWLEPVIKELTAPEWDPTELRQAQTEAVNRQYRDAVQATINTLAQKGVLDSSTAARALGNVSGKALDAYAALEASLAQQVAQNRRDRWNAIFNTIGQWNQWNNLQQSLLTQLPAAAYTAEGALNQYALNESSPAQPTQTTGTGQGTQKTTLAWPWSDYSDLNKLGKELTSYFGVDTTGWGDQQFSNVGRWLSTLPSVGQSFSNDIMNWQGYDPEKGLLGTLNFNNKSLDLTRYWNEGRYW